MSRHFNELTPARLERLALLAEELAEAIQVVGKILRHGYESAHPDGGPDNQVLLETELGHVQYAVTLLVAAGDLDADYIRTEEVAKAERVATYLHHQPSKLTQAALTRAIGAFPVMRKAWHERP